MGEAPPRTMDRTARSAVAAVMQENFGCAVANRFCQLLDDESDPFDTLREAERRRQQQRKKRDEAAIPGARVVPGARAVPGGRRENQKERRQPGGAAAAAEPPQTGQKQPPGRGEQQGFSKRGAEGKHDKAERRPSFRESRPDGTQRPVEFQGERPVERLDCERPVRGRGGGRGGMRSRGRGGRISRSFDAFDQRGKCEFERQSGSDRSGMEQAAPMEEFVKTAEQPWTSEREPLSKAAEAEPVEEVVQEMTLDEWKSLQQQNRPKPEFNLRKPESTVPSKAVVIHRSKYRNDLPKEDFEDDSRVFRRPVNDITSQLDINFGNLPRPGRGSRGARGGRGRGRRVEEIRPQSKMQPVAPNPDDPEDFPALS